LLWLFTLWQNTTLSTSWFFSFKISWYAWIRIFRTWKFGLHRARDPNGRSRKITCNIILFYSLFLFLLSVKHFDNLFFHCKVRVYFFETVGPVHDVQLDCWLIIKLEINYSLKRADLRRWCTQSCEEPMSVGHVVTPPAGSSRQRRRREIIQRHAPVRTSANRPTRFPSPAKKKKSHTGTLGRDQPPTSRSRRNVDSSLVNHTIYLSTEHEGRTYESWTSGRPGRLSRGTDDWCTGKAQIDRPVGATRVTSSPRTSGLATTRVGVSEPDQDVHVQRRPVLWSFVPNHPRPLISVDRAFSVYVAVTWPLPNPSIKRQQLSWF
jgi:hypothetical protein